MGIPLCFLAFHVCVKRGHQGSLHLQNLKNNHTIYEMELKQTQLKPNNPRLVEVPQIGS